MVNNRKSDLAYLLAAYVASYKGGRDLRERLAAHLQAQYTYLPDPEWMLLVGYKSSEIGLYQVAKYGEEGVVYKVEVLSQTSMILLFRDSFFVAGQVIENDEQLVAFLTQYHFPAPPCA